MISVAVGVVQRQDRAVHQPVQPARAARLPRGGAAGVAPAGACSLPPAMSRLCLHVPQSWGGGHSHTRPYGRSPLWLDVLSERSSLIPGKWLHHQSSSSSHDASPHPQGERPAPDPLNSAFLEGRAAPRPRRLLPCQSPTDSLTVCGWVAAAPLFQQHGVQRGGHDVLSQRHRAWCVARQPEAAGVVLSRVPPQGPSTASRCGGVGPAHSLRARARHLRLPALTGAL